MEVKSPANASSSLSGTFIQRRMRPTSDLNHGDTQGHPSPGELGGDPEEVQQTWRPTIRVVRPRLHVDDAGYRATRAGRIVAKRRLVSFGETRVGDWVRVWALVERIRAMGCRSARRSWRGSSLRKAPRCEGALRRRPQRVLRRWSSARATPRLVRSGAAVHRVYVYPGRGPETPSRPGNATGCQAGRSDPVVRLPRAEPVESKRAGNR